MTRRKKVGLGALLVVLGLAGAVYWRLREPAPETRFTGAYRLADGRLAIVVPQRGEELRLIVPDEGERRPLTPAGEARFLVGAAGTPVPPDRQPDEAVDFRLDDGGRPLGFSRRRGDAGAITAERIDLPEERLTLESDGHALRAKLVLPPLAGADGERFAPPYPAAVIVHGSGSESAVDFFDEPYLFAPSGVATLVYDKRGTGGSEGTFTQNFHVLARDVLASVEALRARSDIDPDAIHLVGFSQGGWIAPLAASRTRGIASLVVGYGPMVPVVDEDRWGYVYTLRKKGFEAAIPEADRIHELLVAILDRGESGRWDELAAALDAAEGEAWFDAAAGSDSALGFLSANRWMPLWTLRLYARWMFRDIEGEAAIDRLYDPVPVVAALDVPSLWIFGGDDHSMPTEWTVRELERLAQRGAPVEVVVYPEADHGIVLYDRSGGERRFAGYPPSYMPTMVDWLLRHSHSRPAPSPREAEASSDPAAAEVEPPAER